MSEKRKTRGERIAAGFAGLAIVCGVPAFIALCVYYPAVAMFLLLAAVFCAGYFNDEDGI